jgi:hypothetical protein
MLYKGCRILHKETNKNEFEFFSDFLRFSMDFTRFECIEYMCAGIKLHTCINLVNTKTQCKSIQGAL